MLARSGGDEFAAIQPDTDLESAKQVAEMLKIDGGLGIGAQAPR